MADVTKREILHGIKALSDDVKKLDRKIDRIVKEKKEMRTEIKK